MTVHHGEIMRARLSQHQNKRIRTEFRTFAESHGASAEQQLCRHKKEVHFFKKNFFLLGKIKKKLIKILIITMITQMD